MSIKLAHDYNFGKGFEIVDGKIQAKVQNTATINLSVTDDGIKADFVGTTGTGLLKDVSVKEAENKLVFTVEGGADKEVVLPAKTVDVHLSGLEFADSKLKATLSNGQVKEVAFNAELIVAALESADQAQKQRLATALLEVLRGEEVQDIDGVSKGYLLKA